jgi:hypothetical protein
VIIASVANFFGRTNLKDRGSTWRTTHRDQLAGWGKIAPHLMWRPNTGSPAGWQQGLPDLSIGQTIEDLKFVAENGCIGIYIDSVWEHWATQGPTYYVLAQLAWDPRRDGQAVLDDYYRRGFGPAADNVKSYFSRMEQAREAYVAEYGAESGVLSFTKLYTPTLLAGAEEDLRRAAACVADGPGRYLRRVEFVSAGLAISRLMVQNIEWMGQYWDRQDASLAEKVCSNWQAMERLCQEHPYAVNWGPVRPQTPRMAGLHPENPNPKWKRRAKPEAGKPENDRD